MPTYKTAPETAKEIRTLLKKELGLGTKEVGVRVAKGHGAINVTVKVHGVLAKVKELAEPFAKVDRCERTGDILCGGNLFVFVEKDYRLCAGYREALCAAYVEDILPEGVEIFACGHGFGAEVNGERLTGYTWGPFDTLEEAARAVAAVH